MLNARSLSGQAAALGAAVYEGFTASVIGGLCCLMWEPSLRELLFSQSDPILSLGLYLLICVEIGIAVSVVIAVQWPGAGSRD